MKTHVSRAVRPGFSIVLALVYIAHAAVVLLSLGYLQTNWPLVLCMRDARRRFEKQFPQPVKET